MQFKFLTILAVIALVIGAAQAQSRVPAAIQVVINQPPAKDGVIPIEIIQPAVVSTAPNKLDDFSYFLRNN